MSFFGRLLNHLAGEAAIEKMANSKAMQSVAQRVVEYEKHAAKHAENIAKDPEAAKAAVVQQVADVWKHLKSHIASDLGIKKQPKGPNQIS